MTGAKSLRWEDWPPEDQALWNALVRKGGLLDDAGALSHVRASTQEIIQRRYARWLGWLRASAPEVLAEMPERRATPERLLAWLEAMADLAPASRAAFLDGPVRVLSTAAPQLDWSAQFRLRRIVDRQAARSTSTRKLGRVKSTSVLLDAGLELAGASADTASTELEAAKRRRDGTMIALLALMPMRRRAFAELELGTLDPRLSRIASTFACPSEMTKTGVPWEATVPRLITPLLRRYIDEVRPFFLARGDAQHAYLWTDSKGRPLQPGYLATRDRQGDAGHARGQHLATPVPRCGRHQPGAPLAAGC